MSEQKTRWETTVNKDYLGAYSLDDGKGGYISLNVTIKEVRTATIKTNKGDEVKTVAFMAKGKPMIMNRTHMKTLTKLFRSPYLEDWSGKAVTIYVERNIKAFGSLVDAIRIMDKLPQKPELLPNTKKWDGTVKSLLAGNVTIEQVKVHFKLSKENETLLQNGGI